MPDLMDMTRSFGFDSARADDENEKKCERRKLVKLDFCVVKFSSENFMTIEQNTEKEKRGN